jgi:hypothetical protein
LKSPCQIQTRKTSLCLDQASFENGNKKHKLKLKKKEKKEKKSRCYNLLIQSCELQIPISKLFTAIPKETMTIIIGKSRVFFTRGREGCAFHSQLVLS